MMRVVWIILFSACDGHYVVPLRSRAVDERVPNALVQMSAQVISSHQAELLHRHHAIVRGTRHAVVRRSEIGTDGEATTEQLDDESFFAQINLHNMRDTQYSGLLKLGTPPQEISFIFDTGSANFWVVGKDCKSPECDSAAHRYDAAQSSTAKPWTDDVTVRVKFATGEIKGHLAMDQVGIGQYSVEQVIGIIDKEDGKVFSQIQFEGICGMAWPQMAAANFNPWFDSLMEANELPQNEFSFYLNPDNAQNSALSIGGVDPRIVGEKKVIKTVNPHYWSGHLKAMYIGDEKIEDIPQYVVVDTGTTLYTAPHNIVGNITDKIRSVPCGEMDKAEIPSMHFIMEGIDGEDVNVTLSPEEFMGGPHSDGNCEPAFWGLPIPEPWGPAILFGELFMRDKWTTFHRGGKGDNDPPYIAFGPAKHDPSFLAELAQATEADTTYLRGHKDAHKEHSTAAKELNTASLS